MPGFKSGHFIFPSMSGQYNKANVNVPRDNRIAYIMDCFNLELSVQSIVYTDCRGDLSGRLSFSIASMAFG